MSLIWKIGIPLLLLALVVTSTPYFGRVETSRFSAYAACRKVAMATKGYAEWKHEQTIPKMFILSRVLFSDGFDEIDCHAMGVGPFWIVRKSQFAFTTCSKDLGNGKKMICPEGYFGVNP